MWGTVPAVVGTDCSARTADPRNLPGRRKLQEKVLHTCFRCSLIQRAPFSSCIFMVKYEYVTHSIQV